MAKRILDLRLFHYALAAAEYGSFRRAAAALNIQQSTVSRGVRSLEHQVGADLFERSHTGLRLTSAGDWFFREATIGFDHLERAVQRAGAMQNGKYGELKIGVTIPFMALSDAFQQFRQEHKEVFVEVVENTTAESSALVQQRKLDVAFIANPPTDATLCKLHLRDEKMVVVVPKSHPMASAPRFLFQDLRHENIVLSTGGLGPDIAAYLARRLAQSEVRPNVQLHSVGQFDLINMVAREFGVTIVLGALSGSTFEGVAFIPLTGKNVFSLHAIWLETNPNPALKGLLHILRKSAHHHSGV